MTGLVTGQVLLVVVLAWGLGLATVVADSPSYDDLYDVDDHRECSCCGETRGAHYMRLGNGHVVDACPPSIGEAGNGIPLCHFNPVGGAS